MNNDIISPGAASLTFPREALVGSVGDLARVLTEGTEVPEEFCFAAGLTALGAICGTRLKLAIGCEVEPRLYTILLGESYEVKKSTAMRRVLNFFERLDVQGRPHVIYGVGSAEGLARELDEHPHMLLAYDELKSLVDKFQVQGSTLLAIIASLFENDRWQIATKKLRHSVTVDDAHLSIVGCCTRETRRGSAP